MVKTGVYCPYCAAELFDPDVDRCTSCGMFVAPELRAALRQKVPTATATVASPTPVHPSQLANAATSNEANPTDGIPTARVANEPRTAFVRLGQNPASNDSQQRRRLWQTILFQSAIGLSLWAWAIVALGRLGPMPFAWLPAGFAVAAGLLGTSRTNRWASLSAVFISLVAIVVAGFVS